MTLYSNRNRRRPVPVLLPHRRPASSVGARAVVVGLLAAILLPACSTDPGKATGADQATGPTSGPGGGSRDVELGIAQDVEVASSFGPGTIGVPATVTVLAFRDHVAPDPAVRPVTPGTRWASAQVRVCRSGPVVLGFPAWVLGDDEGRTAQQSRVLHPQFPQPPLPDAPSGCVTGWVTWVVAPDLVPTKVTFEQTREVPGAWRLRPAAS